MRVIGTAGHVDHGKSTLVRALTGIDPDRLKEEKSRGMTIDLGFAWMELAMPGEHDIEQIGIVDVPGHIDFIKNMLAGVGGIDAAILVIAADEGVMPQTREHLAILDLLAVPAGLVALTKIDLVDEPEWLDLVELDVDELLQPTRLGGSPVFRVSATTGEGLDELRSGLASVLLDLAPRRNRARPRLPIDRIFSLSGFGTVVTGTLSDGHFAVGDSVQILPAGLPARIRGLQTHRQKIARGEPGSRLALNLTGVSTDEIRRGNVVVSPGTLRETLLIDVGFQLLGDAPKPIVHNQRVDFFSGATEVGGRVRLLGVEEIKPGSAGWLQLRLESPVVVAAGDRYILRQPSPSVTLGGGAVLNPHPGRRWRRYDEAVLKRLDTLARGAPDEVLLQSLARFPFSTRKQLFAHSGLDLTIAEDAFAGLESEDAVIVIDLGQEPAYATVEAFESVQGTLANHAAAYHTEFPLRKGIARGELRSRLQSNLNMTLSVRLFNGLIEAAQASGRIEADDNHGWVPGRKIILTPRQQSSIEKVMAQFESAGFAPPNNADVLRGLEGDSEVLEMLVEQGQLVRLGGGLLFRHQEYGEVVDRIVTHLTAHGTITLAETRDLLETSRKYAQAILETMDSERITRREGDYRVLRKG